MAFVDRYLKSVYITVFFSEFVHVHAVWYVWYCSFPFEGRKCLDTDKGFVHLLRFWSHIMKAQTRRNLHKHEDLGSSTQELFWETYLKLVFLSNFGLPQNDQTPSSNNNSWLCGWLLRFLLLPQVAWMKLHQFLPSNVSLQFLGHTKWADWQTLGCDIFLDLIRLISWGVVRDLFT